MKADVKGILSTPLTQSTNTMSKGNSAFASFANAAESTPKPKPQTVVEGDEITVSQLIEALQKLVAENPAAAETTLSHAQVGSLMETTKVTLHKGMLIFGE